MASPKAFYSYMENEEKLNMLSDEQAGRLYKSLYAYSRTGEKPDLSDDPLLAYAFADFVIDLDRDREKYEQTCQRRSEAGKKGSQAKQANAKNDLAKQANADFAKNFSANVSKSSETETEAEAETEIEDDIHRITSTSEVLESTDASRYVIVKKSFNEICKDLPKITSMTADRKKRIDEAAVELTKRWWTFRDLFTKVSKTDFLMGKDGDWKATFDWIMKPENIAKITEGFYDKRKPKPKGGSVYSTEGASFDVRRFEDGGDVT